jgi:acyl-coenzyme A synthetase/AMP-(fatty) acid ligase
LVIYPPGTPSLDELGALIKREGITLLFITTSLFRQMVERNPGDFKSVRELITGGEAMPLALAKAVWRELPRTRVINAYGPTECTTFASMYPMNNMETMGDNVPIGKPIENTTMFILDRYGNPLPVGVPGEIHIGGEGVAQSYWNRPEMTAASFVPDPFGRRPGGRLYRTGDIGKYREDGNILFLGRRDRQIKLSGYRIELAEVEAAIASHPDVSGVAVRLAEDGDKRLTAFVELVPGRRLTYGGLREYLLKLLPHYMIPSQLEVMDKLPLTSSGKIDFPALSSRKVSPLPGQDEYVPPRNAVEKLLVRMWEEILRAERVGVTDNFFDLGGQSLVATRLLSRMRETFQAELTMRQFFDNPTVGGLAAIFAQDEHLVKRAEMLLAFKNFSHGQTDSPELPADAT